MDNSFFLYIEQLELMAFFSGYPLFYILIQFLGTTQQTNKLFTPEVVSLLPITYAFIGLLLLGMELDKLFTGMNQEKIQFAFQGHYLLIWALLSLLFFIPLFYKIPVLSLVHSLVFFYFIIRDLVLDVFFQSIEKSQIKNDMTIYTRSLLLNLLAFVLIWFLSFLYKKMKNSFR